MFVSISDTLKYLKRKERLEGLKASQELLTERPGHFAASPARWSCSWEEKRSSRGSSSFPLYVFGLWSWTIDYTMSSDYNKEEERRWDMTCTALVKISPDKRCFPVRLTPFEQRPHPRVDCCCCCLHCLLPSFPAHHSHTKSHFKQTEI